MGFFDKLNASMTNASRTVAQKAKNFNESNKLNSQLKVEEHNIQQNLIEIGQKYYERCKENPSEDFKTMVESIAESEQKIEQLKQEIEEIRAREPELVPIPEEVTVSKSANTPTEPSAMVCMNCGNTYESGNTFCAVCGQKLTAQYSDLYTANNAPVQTENDVQVKPEMTEMSGTTEDEVVDAVISEPEQSAVQEDETVSKPSFCPYCGKPLNTLGQLFCGECGKPL